MIEDETITAGLAHSLQHLVLVSGGECCIEEFDMVVLGSTHGAEHLVGQDLVTVTKVQLAQSAAQELQQTERIVGRTHLLAIEQGASEAGEGLHEVLPQVHIEPSLLIPRTVLERIAIERRSPLTFS